MDYLLKTKIKKLFLWGLSGVVFIFLSLSPVDVSALPTLDEIVSGEAELSSLDENTLRIDAADKTIINFKDFDIGSSERVIINLPSASSELLSRVSSGVRSFLLGGLESNGIFLLVNEAGVTIGDASNIDVGGFIFSTRGITDDDFLSSNYVFEKSADTDNLLINKGNIEVADNSFGVLIGGALENRGEIIAPSGKVVLAGGEKVTLGISGNNLVSVAIDKAQIEEVLDEDGNLVIDQVSNSGIIEANSGVVRIEASSVPGVFDKAINTSGVVRANTVSEEEGRIVLRSTGDVYSTGDLQAEEGSIDIEAEGAVTSKGSLVTNTLREEGASFLVGGEYRVGEAFVENDDNAVTLSTGDYSGETSDAENIIVEADATLTLVGNTIFRADSDTNGTGSFTMNTGSSINGDANNYYDLTLYSTDDAVLRGLTNIGLLSLNKSQAESNPTYRVASDSKSRSLILNNSILSVDAGNKFVYNLHPEDNTLTISEGSAVSGEGTFQVTGVQFLSNFGLADITFSNEGSIDIDNWDYYAYSFWSGSGGDFTIPATTYGTVSDNTKVSLYVGSKVSSYSEDWDYTLGGDTVINGDLDIYVDAETYGSDKTGFNVYTAGYDLDVTGDMTVGGQWQETVEGELNTIVNGGKLTVEGDLLVQENTNEIVTLDISDSSSDLDLEGNLTLTGGTISAPAAADNTSFTVGGDWEVSNDGVFTHNNGRVVFDASDTGNTIVTTSTGDDDFYQVKFANASGEWILSDSLTVLNALTISSGSLDLSGNNLNLTGESFSNEGTLKLAGDETLTSFTNDTDSGVVEYTGGGSYTGLSAGDSYYDLTFSGAGDYILNSDLLVVNDLTITAGNVDASSDSLDLDFDGNLILSGGSLSAPAAADNTSFTVGGDWEVSNDGVFTHNNGRVVFDASDTGNTIVTTSTGDDDFYQVEFANASGEWTISDSLTVEDDFLLSSGGVIQSGDLTVTADYAQTGGSFTAADSLNDNFSVGGSFSLEGGSFNRYTGLGISANPYKIRDVYDLQAMKSFLTAFFELQSDITAGDTANWNSGAGFVPIGDSSGKFTGSLNGANHKIKGLYINRPSTDYVGLLGETDGASVKNIGLVNLDVTGGEYTGGLVGGFWKGRLLNAYTKGSIAGTDSVGGLAGIIAGGLGPVVYADIDNSYSEAAVSGYDSVGGFTGTTWLADIRNSYATGDVSGNTQVGGFIGYCSWSKVALSKAYGFVEGDNYVGGFIGADGGSSYEKNVYINNVWDTLESLTFQGVGSMDSNPEGITSTIAVEDVEDYLPKGKNLEVAQKGVAEVEIGIAENDVFFQEEEEEISSGGSLRERGRGSSFFKGDEKETSPEKRKNKKN